MKGFTAVWNITSLSWPMSCNYYDDTTWMYLLEWFSKFSQDISLTIILNSWNHLCNINEVQWEFCCSVTGRITPKVSLNPLLDVIREGTSRPVTENIPLNLLRLQMVEIVSLILPASHTMAVIYMRVLKTFTCMWLSWLNVMLLFLYI